MSKRRETAAREALRIIEAAGDGETEDVDFAEARYRLRCSVQKTAEREAEDAKVRAWRKAITEARGTTSRAVPWNELTELQRNDMRTDYRAAREFFTKEIATEKAHNHVFGDEPDGTCPNCDEKPAPRVLQYGDPEPTGGKWRSAPGYLYERRSDAWWRIDDGAEGEYSLYWHNLSGVAFPMTEVTE